MLPLKGQIELPASANANAQLSLSALLSRPFWATFCNDEPTSEILFPGNAVAVFPHCGVMNSARAAAGSPVASAAAVAGTIHTHLAGDVSGIDLSPTPGAHTRWPHSERPYAVGPATVL